jgi:hypothetical protein
VTYSTCDIDAPRCAIDVPTVRRGWPAIATGRA